MNARTILFAILLIVSSTSFVAAQNAGQQSMTPSPTFEWFGDGKLMIAAPAGMRVRYVAHGTAGRHVSTQKLVSFSTDTNYLILAGKFSSVPKSQLSVEVLDHSFFGFKPLSTIFLRHDDDSETKPMYQAICEPKKGDPGKIEVRIDSDNCRWFVVVVGCDHMPRDYEIQVMSESVTSALKLRDLKVEIVSP